MVSAASTAITRIGRIRLPTRSDHTPATMRPAAPTTCTTATSWPAATGLQPRSDTRNVTANVAATNCGATSIALAECRRSSVLAGARRRGTGTRRTTPCGPGAAGRPPRAHQHRRDQAQHRGQRDRRREAEAVPERRQGRRRDAHADRLRGLPDAHRQPALRRGEPAEHHPPARRVHRRRARARHEQARRRTAPARAARGSPAAAPPVAARPAAITMRSPYRSAAAPHAMSASSNPSSGAETSTRRPVSDSPRCAAAPGSGTAARRGSSTWWPARPFPRRG